MKDTLRIKMKGLAEALMADVNEAYNGDNAVEFFNSLNRFKVGTEALHNLATTAAIMDDLEQPVFTAPEKEDTP
jgi:hypothetical protein